MRPADRRAQKLRSNHRRRKDPSGPWYDQKQVRLPPQLRELQRLYWRANKRLERMIRSGQNDLTVRNLDITVAVLQVRKAAQEARKARSLSASRLRSLRGEVRELTKMLDDALALK